MALTNFFREPKRELTETLLGIAVLIGPAYLDYRIALFLHENDDPTCPLPLPLALVVGAIIMGASVAGVLAAAWTIHHAGEGLCNLIANHLDIEIRPRDRH